MKGYIKTKEHRKKISKGLKGIIRSKEYKDNMSKIISEKYLNGGYYNTKLKYNSIKLNREIYTMSSYEFKFAVILDLLESVEYYKYQPFYLKDEKTNKRYIPDFLFIMNGQKYLVEIDKYVGYKQSHGYNWKLKLAQNYCNKNDTIFLYLDLDEIYKFLEKNKDNINFDNINLYKQNNNNPNIPIYLSDIFSRLKFNINMITPDLKDISIPSIEINNISSRKFKYNNNNFLLSIYNNFWSCKWKNSRFNPSEAIKYNVTFKTIINNIIKNKLSINTNNIINQIKKERYSISFFPDSWAYWIYTKYLLPNNNIKILDVSGGFGGRLLGFYHFIKKYNIKNYKYDYIDVNTQSTNNTKILINKLNINNINIINNKFEDCENIFKNNYDLMFTSIPYYDLEIYNNIKLDDIYKSEMGFIKNYINNIFKLNSKQLIINISEKYKYLIKNDIIKHNNYKLKEVTSIKLTKHPFQKTSNTELFYIYNK